MTCKKAKILKYILAIKVCTLAMQKRQNDRFLLFCNSGLWRSFRWTQNEENPSFCCFRIPNVHTSIGWAKMHEVFKSLLPRYFLKDICVKWSQFEFQTISSKFHYTPSMGPGGPICPKTGPRGPIEGVGPQTPNFF